jgi:hypothetical protein
MPFNKLPESGCFIWAISWCHCSGIQKLQQHGEASATAEHATLTHLSGTWPISFLGLYFSHVLQLRPKPGEKTVPGVLPASHLSG